ncbi:MAG: hypothetical protein NVS3B14_05660 [Ktedonobacteraceae bacterium]
MPYVGHSTLLDVLQEGPLSLEYAGELLQQIVSGLQYAHDQGVIHRDIKPSNILLRDDHYAYLADFGLAKSMDDPGKVTQTGVLLGTPEYMAPELADGPATRSTDIYALGILLYPMVTGKMPFTGDTPLAVYLKQMREQPIPPSRINPAIPHLVDLVIMRALEKDPRRRYDSSMVLAQAYTRAVEESRAHPSPSHQSRPSVYETEAIERVPPLNERAPSSRPPITPLLPMIEPAIPIPTPQQPEKLVLPPVRPDLLAARRQPTPTRNNEYARQTPVYPPPYPPRRRVPARASNRGSTLGISVLMGVLFLLLVGVVLFAFYGHSTNNQVTGKSPQATAGSVITPSTSASTPTTNPSPSPQPTQPNFNATATAVTGNTPLLSDSLSSNTNGSWTNDGVGCAFQNGTYHVLVSQQSFLQPCTNANFTFNDGAIKVDLSLLRGSDAGIIFRVSGDQFYDFEINNQGQYYFRRHDANAGGNYVYLAPNTRSAAINPGSAPNTLLMIANGGDFLLYINGAFVKEVKDSNFSTGQIGFVAGTLAPVSNADASFSNLTVYPLS